MDGPNRTDVVKTIGSVLEHYGIKGMRWGVRRDNPSGSSVPASDDAKKTAEYKARVKAGGTKALTTKELQDLVNRMNLEQQYNRSRPRTVGEQTRRFVTDTLLNIGKQEAAKYASREIAKALAARS